MRCSLAALLDTPGVRSVTIGGTDSSGALVSPVTYRLIPKSRREMRRRSPPSPRRSSTICPLRTAKSAGPNQWKAVVDAKNALKDR